MSARWASSSQPASAGHRGSARIAAAACVLALLGGASAGCSVVNKINKIRHAVDSNRRTIKTFTEGLESAQAMPFQASYVTTGDAPTTVVYAVQPPKNISFSETSSGSDASATKLIANSSGQYSCTHATPGGQWSCDKLGKASAGAQKALFAIYTPQHWVTFLHVLSLGAGLAGAKVRNSTRSINGFSMNCVNLFTKGEGTSTICTTDQNILGYVKVAAQSTSFELKSYTPTPPGSAFELPPGATVTGS
jgi:hypothetical protein